ncbi:hypothetical protein AGMMS4952_25030 [Spirochaetia bacterium]|nr:hypothetical protein AGMMS4952_25030 [Spirochaetia bacterium]
MGVNKKYKDSLFSWLFSDPDTLRELYSAIEGILVDPALPIRINTLEKVLYMNQINDISFEIGGILVVLIEHQSTINPNMPLRLLMYIARIYEKIIDRKKRHSGKKVPVPQPEFIVLYNGKAQYPDEAILKLSDLFADAAACGLITSGPPALELTVKVYNINQGRNEAMVRKCERLRGYSIFVGKAREYKDSGKSKEESLEMAIRYCIDHDILKAILEAHASEVINMLLEEWKIDEAKEAWQEEAWEDGRVEGEKKGRVEGEKKGRVEGREETKKEDAKNFLALGVSPATVAKATGLDMETIKELAGQ